MNRRGFLGSIGKGLAALGITVTTPAVAKAMVEERVFVIPKDVTQVRALTVPKGHICRTLVEGNELRGDLETFLESGGLLVIRARQLRNEHKEAR